MKHLSRIILGCILVFISCGKELKKSESNKEKISTFYFIRHAEKDRSDATNDNPHLLDIGKQRAEKWSDVLKNINFDAIYSTNYNRTKETAKPTALKNQLELTIYNPKTIDIPIFLKENDGKNVLVVGHSNSTPEFVNAILKTNIYKHIEDNNNGNIYIISINANADIITNNLLFVN